MIKYAIYDYIPQRKLRRASFETQDLSRMILMFKNGRKAATSWAVRVFRTAMSQLDLHDTIIVCVPASCQRTYIRRFRRFSKALCQVCGAIDGFPFVSVEGKRDKAHIIKGEPSQRQLSNVTIDTAAVKGRKVVIIDDICTTCRTANIFISMMQEAGADVRLALFLAKTKNYKNFH